MRRLVSMALVLVAGCSGDLADVEDVRDLRVLAVRADPPEVFIDSDPTIDVSFSVLVVDPRQPPLATTPVSYTFSFCPVESDQACLDFAQRRDAGPEESRALLDSLRALHEDGTATSEAEAGGLTPEQASTRAAWPYAVLPYQLQLTPSETQGLASYFFQTNLLGLGMGALPSVIFDVAGADDQITSAKRFTFNVRDPHLVESVGFDFGYRVCDDGEPESNGCVGLRQRVRNANPTFDRIQVSLGALAGGEFSDVPSTGFSMRGSSVIRILPVFTGDSYETFQELVTDPTSGRISARDVTESLSVSWFATAGELQDALTTPIFTKTLDTEFRAPRSDRVPPDGLAVSVYMVARDQRGGVAWQSFEIFVTP